jgi:hypothetical protein
VLERGDVRRIEVEAHEVIEECVRLAGGEAQVRGAQLEQLAAAAQPGQGQGRVRARGDGDGDLGRQVAEQERHSLVDVRCVDDVVVVESQHGRSGELVEIVDQADQHLRRKGPAALQQRQRLRTHLRATHLDGRDEVSDEPAQLAVPGIERQPRHAWRRPGRLTLPVAPTRRQPLRDQGGLAEPGRSGHQDKPRHRRRLDSKAIGKPRTRNEPPSHRRDMKLGAQNRHSAILGGAAAVARPDS